MRGFGRRVLIALLACASAYALAQPAGEPDAQTSEPATPASEAASGSGLAKPSVPEGFGEKPGATAPSTAASGGDCVDGKGVVPLAPDRFAGTWDDPKGGSITISPKSPGSTTDFSMKGRHDDWSGSLKGSTLTFKRKPKQASELPGAAPDWAKAIVLGQIEWSIELEGRVLCGEPVLEGKWYPGEFKYELQLGGTGAGARTASVTGKGAPRDIKYTRPPDGIVGVEVLENQSAYDALGKPYYVYPFQPGADNTGGALTRRLLYVYGRGLPRNRRGDIVVTSSDPNIQYTVDAVESERSSAPAWQERFERGLTRARLANTAGTHRDIEGMTALLLRVDLRKNAKPGLLPGMKSFKINELSGSWRLGFSDDTANLSFARAINGYLGPPSEVAQDRVLLTRSVFSPERVFLELRTKGLFPLQSVPLKLRVNERDVTWNGAATIDAALVPGTTNVFRTPAIELVEGAPTALPGAYALQARAGDHIYATIQDPWLLRTIAIARADVLSGPDDIGRTWHYYLYRAAKADGIDPGGLKNSNEWAVLAGKSGASINNYSILITVFNPAYQKMATWKDQLVKMYRSDPRPIVPYNQQHDNLVERVSLTVGDHAALLMFRDTFVDQMNVAIANLKTIKDSYANGAKPAIIRGLRKQLQPGAWSADLPWTRFRVACPEGECPFSHALSESYLEKTFPNNPDAAERWANKATAEALDKFIAAGTKARDKAKGVAETDLKGLVDAIGYSYEPMLPSLLPRLVRREDDGRWVADQGAIWSLHGLHTVTDAREAQQDLANADTRAILQLASVPLIAFAAPGLVGVGFSNAAAGAALGVSDVFVTEVGAAYFTAPDTRFALGASLAVGAEFLNEQESKEHNLWYETQCNVIVGSIMSMGMEAVVSPAIHAVGKSAAKLARPALQLVRSGGAAAFRRLSTETQHAVLALMLRAKSVEQAGALSFAGAFEREAVAAADRLAADVGAAKPATPPPGTAQPIAALGDTAAVPRTPTVEPGFLTEIDEQFFRRAESSTPIVERRGYGPTGTEPGVGPKGTSQGGPKPDPNATPPGPGADPNAPPRPAAKPLTPEEEAAARAAAAARALAKQPKQPLAPAEPDAWENFPTKTDTIVLKPSPTEQPVTYILGSRRGVGGYVWAVDIRARGRVFLKNWILKLTGASDPREYFQAIDVVTQSEAGYKLIKGKTSIRCLETKFYPKAVKADGSPLPYMEQEALGPRRKTLREVYGLFSGDMPEGVKAKFKGVYQQLQKARILPEDFNRGNLYVELPESVAVPDNGDWSKLLQGLKNGSIDVEIGVLDFDRVILFDDYLAGKAGKVGNYLSWWETVGAWFIRRNGLPGMPSMEAVYTSAQFQQFIKNSGIRLMSFSEMDAFFARNPGPYWPGDYDYYLEKMMEHNGYFMFDPATKRLRKNMFEPDYFRDMLPLINDSTRFAPFDVKWSPRAGGASKSTSLLLPGRSAPATRVLRGAAIDNPLRVLRMAA